MISQKMLVALWLLSALTACKNDPSSPAAESAAGANEEATAPSSAAGSKTPAADVTGAAPSPATPSTVAPSAVAPSAAVVTGRAHEEVIEAGCTYDARQLTGNDGDTYRISCPAGCEKGARTHGTGVYTADTHVCKAAIHAGAIKPEGGTVTIRLEPGRPAYRGSTQNGVESYDYGKYSKSYAVLTVASGEATSAAAGSAAPSAAPGAAGSSIEAGCTYDARQLVGNDGDKFNVACPPGCGQKGRTHGTGVYTADTAICGAAIHAGAIKPEGGTVTVRLEPGRPAYRGSTQNGIKSYDYGKYSKSYAVVVAGGDSAAVPSGAAAPSGASAADGSVIEAGCSYDARQLVGNDGQTFKVACPPCEQKGRTYGTGVYTADTSICSAAVHAGAIKPEGGTVTIRLEPGRPAYRGSTQNGVKSFDYGKYSKSYAVVTP